MTGKSLSSIWLDRWLAETVGSMVLKEQLVPRHSPSVTKLPRRLHVWSAVGHR